MIVQYLSDIHHERFTRKQALPITPKGDVIVLAGDISDCPKNFSIFLIKLAQITDVPVIMVLGNHEYYFGDFDTAVESYRHTGRMYYPNLHIIDDPLKDMKIIDGVLFTGGTLWTDYAEGTHLKHARDCMWEITNIPCFMANEVKAPCLDPDRVVQKHIFTRRQLMNVLCLNQEKYKLPSVVVTHHSPSFYLVTDKFLGGKLNGAFHSNCDRIILEYSPNLWIYGHTHASTGDYFGNTKIVSNQHGYIGQVDPAFQWSALEEVKHEMWQDE